MNERMLHVLLIEDSPIIRQMVKKMLAASGRNGFKVTDCENLTQGIHLLQSESPDVVILDLSLPESTGVETVTKVRAVDSDVPIVVFTGTDDDNLAMAAMHLGADDYLVKKEVQQGSLLTRTLRYTVEKKKTQLALNRYAIEMERLAETRARQLVHQDRLAAIGTMSAGIAHEIRGPLSFISNNTDALKQNWQEVADILKKHLKNSDCIRSQADMENLEYIIEETPNIIDDIGAGAERIVEITTGLKKFSRKGNAEVQFSNIESCVDSALNLCTNLLKYGILVNKEYHTQEIELPLQVQKMVQVFVNLFYNAAQAMGEKGEIQISTHVEDEKLEVAVIDTGPGIPDEKIDTIFEPYYTTKPEDIGTGLGLSICREIVSEHGGTIVAQNRPDGAMFLMQLPLNTENGITANPPAS